MRERSSSSRLLRLMCPHLFDPSQYAFYLSGAAGAVAAHAAAAGHGHEGPLLGTPALPAHLQGGLGMQRLGHGRFAEVYLGYFVGSPCTAQPSPFSPPPPPTTGGLGGGSSYSSSAAVLPAPRACHPRNAVPVAIKVIECDPFSDRSVLFDVFTEVTALERLASDPEGGGRGVCRLLDYGFVLPHKATGGRPGAGGAGTAPGTGASGGGGGGAMGGPSGQLRPAGASALGSPAAAGSLHNHGHGGGGGAAGGGSATATAALGTGAGAGASSGVGSIWLVFEVYPMSLKAWRDKEHERLWDEADDASQPHSRGGGRGTPAIAGAATAAAAAASSSSSASLSAGAAAAGPGARSLTPALPGAGAGGGGGGAPSLMLGVSMSSLTSTSTLASAPSTNLLLPGPAGAGLSGGTGPGSASASASASGSLPPTTPALGLAPLPADARLAPFLDAFFQVMVALRVLARNRVVHYDLKCDNILVRPVPGTGGRVQVALSDFGEATVDTASTHVGRGTENIQSPEMILLRSRLNQADDKHDRLRMNGADAASDVWSLGCLFFELLTGR